MLENQRKINHLARIRGTGPRHHQHASKGKTQPTLLTLKRKQKKNRTEENQNKGGTFLTVVVQGKVNRPVFFGLLPVDYLDGFKQKQKQHFLNALHTLR